MDVIIWGLVCTQAKGEEPFQDSYIHPDTDCGWWGRAFPSTHLLLSSLLPCSSELEGLLISEVKASALLQEAAALGRPALSARGEQELTSPVRQGAAAFFHVPSFSHLACTVHYGPLRNARSQSLKAFLILHPPHPAPLSVHTHVRAQAHAHVDMCSWNSGTYTDTSWAGTWSTGSQDSQMES